MTSDMLNRFNRDTRWLATGLLGTVVFAALVLAAQLQEHHPKSVVLSEERVRTDVDHALTRIAPQENSSSEMGQQHQLRHPVPRSVLKQIATTFRRMQVPGISHIGKRLRECSSRRFPEQDGGHPSGQGSLT
jgi:hypothetical protein